MYTLKNEALEVSILDPVVDQERLGSRYCTGGYIFQVADGQHGPLLSGPTYPDDFNWYDGQGIPDAFNLGPLYEPAAANSMVLIIGVGLCDVSMKRVHEFCRWQVQQEPATISMRTAQSFQRFGLELERTVSLHQRTLRSATRLQNTGKLPLPIHWFPHPFFPHPQTDELCRFNIPVHFPASERYEVAESGFIARKGWPWQDGPFQALDHAAQNNLVVLQKHPSLGLVAGTTSYVPGYFPIWGNRHTFSWEPFLERTVGVDQETSWWIDYDF